jgi:succinate-semialdehyde dehydrogenase/glutarate-semialdehyde dehydrogenase
MTSGTMRIRGRPIQDTTARQEVPVTTSDGQRKDEQDLLAKVPTGLFIGGSWREASSGDTFAVQDPATGTEIARVADATAEDGMAALDAAAAAQADWARTAPRDRAELLRAGFEAVTARAEDFALLMTLEMGKSLAEARGEVGYGSEFLRWFSEIAAHESGRYATAPDGKSRLLVTKRPVGPSLLITPWNFPLAMATRKIAPALAAGCTVVVKPAQLTPLTTLLFTEVMREVGVPDGVINVVPSSSASRVTGPILGDPRLRKLSFTGSTEVGRKLLATASERILRTSMELGGNAPLLVFEDADLDQAVAGAMLAKFRNGGEACTSANRLYVQESVAEEFSARFAEAVRALKLARGTEEGADVGPLIDADARDKVTALVQDAVDRGAEAAVGGVARDGAGYFFEPTVLTGIAPGSRVLDEEIFGPVAPVLTFADEAEAIELANATEFGLIAYAFTRDTARTLRLTEQLETGMLGINSGVISNPAAPFGGVKESGLGREGGVEGIAEYQETVYVGIADPFAG